ncbi:Lsr2 family DNA-binding protein [Nocardia rhamnosiphila]|uniref:Histone-like nucleoid-structuring protein Lsr2 n=1 Tax=Nocardia rhamnosiphila TaxID=426716 RepID=A0ABV2WKG9_9NOCA
MGRLALSRAVVPRGTQRAGQPARGTRQQDTKAVREWARRNGHDVPERGRIPSMAL